MNVVKRDTTKCIPTETTRLYPDKWQIYSFGESLKISETLPLTQKFQTYAPPDDVIFAMATQFLRRKPVSLQNFQGPFVTDKEHRCKNFSQKFLILCASTTKQLTSSTEKGYNPKFVTLFHKTTLAVGIFANKTSFQWIFCLGNKETTQKPNLLCS